MTSYQLVNQFQPYLLPRERIIWTGQPKQGLALSGMDTFLIPFSLLWTGGVLTMFVGVLKDPTSGGPDVILIVFLAIGLYFTIGRFLHDAALRKKMYYAVTDQRILVIGGTRSSQFTSLDLFHLPRLDLAEQGDGTGTISFESSGWFSNLGSYGGFGGWLPSLNAGSRLFRIKDSRKVYELIRDHSRK